MSKLKFLILLFVWNVTSQELIGFVYNNDIPVSNVEIYVKDSFVRTQSDNNGKFSLKAKKGDLVIFSHINMYTKKIIVKDFKNIKINLKAKINILDEVKIKAKKKKFKKNTKLKSIQSRFGKVKTRGAGYAIHSLFAEDIKNSTVELPQALVGKVPNYTLTEKGVILRGKGFQTAYALWDIDGMIFEGLPPYINPEDVESISVITSPAGTIPYGKRGRGGVIVVNTVQHTVSRKNKEKPTQLHFFQQRDNKLNYDEKELFEIIKRIQTNVDSLRLLAFAYKNKGNSKLALKLNRFLLASDSDNIKSYRDVAESFIEMGEINKAWNVYKIFLKRKGGNIDDISFNIIFHDMERLYHAYNVKEIIENKFVSQKKSSKLYENEIRIIFEWTVPNQDLSIEIINPKNQSINFQLGDNSAKNCFIEEFFIDTTLNGNWQVNLSKIAENKLNGFLKVTIYRNWISPNTVLPEVKFFALSKVLKTKYKLLDL